MLNYNHLRYFWVVARKGHLTQAAEELNLSQSALSAQIRKLEHQLGHDLFERVGRRLKLTGAGQIALEYADTIFGAGGELLARLSDEGHHQNVTVRVGALTNLSRNFQNDFLEPLYANPDVKIILRSSGLSDLLGALEAHQLDVVLVNQVPFRDATTPWTARVVKEQKVSLVGTPARLQGETDPESILASHPLVIPTMPSSVRTGFDALVETMNISPRIAAEVDDMAMMRVLARADIGVAVLPPIVVKDELTSSFLEEACVLPRISETFTALRLKKAFANPLVDRLLISSMAQAEA
ncbi:MAG: LysR family transcriptional regulator [Pseudomonadota bacterium]